MTQPTDNVTDPVLQYFLYGDLPPHLQEASKPFAQEAARLVRTTPRCPQRTTALWKLVEAKDAAIRALLPERVVTVSDLE